MQKNINNSKTPELNNTMNEIKMEIEYTDTRLDQAGKIICGLKESSSEEI